MSAARTVSALCMLALLAGMASMARAAPYEAIRLDQGATQGVLWVKVPAQEPKGVVVIVPGAQMVADRYTWLSEGLVADGYASVLIEPALQWITLPGQPGRELPARYVTIPHALEAVAYATRRWPEATARRFAAVGHSLGAAVLLELLDPAEAARNPNTNAPQGFPGISSFDLAVILGTSLQSTLRSMTLPYRSDTRPLSRPVRTRLLFVAASNDGMAPPDVMRKTAARYAPPVDLEVIPGGNHLGWSPGRGPLDRADLDGQATISQEEQDRRTLDVIRRALQQP